MASVIKAVSFDAADALALATFWAAALGSDVDEDSTADKAFVEAAGWGGPSTCAAATLSSPVTSGPPTSSGRA